jgi:hypothetical protein
MRTCPETDETPSPDRLGSSNSKPQPEPRNGAALFLAGLAIVAARLAHMLNDIVKSRKFLGGQSLKPTPIQRIGVKPIFQIDGRAAVWVEIFKNLKSLRIC